MVALMRIKMLIVFIVLLLGCRWKIVVRWILMIPMLIGLLRVLAVPVEVLAVPYNRLIMKLWLYLFIEILVDSFLTSSFFIHIDIIIRPIQPALCYHS